MPSLTVYTAPTGTPTTPVGSTVPEKSLVGHMFYVISGGGDSHDLSFGFAPLQEHVAGGVVGTTPGHVYTDDNRTYGTVPIPSTTIYINQTQYDALKLFGQSRAALAPSDNPYQAESNSCVDFVWDALAGIGVERPVSLDGSLTLPQWNTKYIAEKLPALESATLAGSPPAPVVAAHPQAGVFDGIATTAAVAGVFGSKVGAMLLPDDPLGQIALRPLSA